MKHSVGIKDIIFVVLFSVLIFFGAFFIFSSLKKAEVRKQVSIRSLDKDVSRKVNKKIQRLQTRDSILKSKLAESVHTDMDDILEEDFSNQEKEKYNLDVFEQDLQEADFAQPATISDKVQALLSSEDRTSEERARIIQRYKEELIEKARQQGWAIEINDDLEVTSATRL